MANCRRDLSSRKRSRLKRRQQRLRCYSHLRHRQVFCRLDQQLRRSGAATASRCSSVFSSTCESDARWRHRTANSAHTSNTNDSTRNRIPIARLKESCPFRGSSQSTAFPEVLDFGKITGMTTRKHFLSTTSTPKDLDEHNLLLNGGCWRAHHVKGIALISHATWLLFTRKLEGMLVTGQNNKVMRVQPLSLLNGLQPTWGQRRDRCCTHPQPARWSSGQGCRHSRS